MTTPTKEQPDHATKVRTLNGEDTGWDYRCGVPYVHHLWTAHDWIRYIGDRWFRKPQKAPQ